MKFVKTFVAALLFSSVAFGQRLNEAEIVPAISCNKAAVNLYEETVRPAAMQQPLVDNDKPLYVYFIHDPEDDMYYKQNMLGLSGWSRITKADVWTVKKTAERTLSSMYGSRADRCVIETFILIPSNE